MKKLFFGFVAIFILATSFISCKYRVKNKNVDDSKKTENITSDQNENLFKPGPDWKLSWSDEFEGDSIDVNNWNFQVMNPGHFNGEWQAYTNSSKNAYVENGCLVIKAIQENDAHKMGSYASARLHTGNKQSWKYGKIAARIKLPYGHGIWPAFWMLGENIDEIGGDTPWPGCGEIDILEMYGSKNDSVVEANIHYADASGVHASMGAAPFHLKESKFADAFHVFELDWDADRISWLVDGVEYKTVSIAANEMSEFHQKFYILLNLAVGGKWAGYPDKESVFPQLMYVDWVRVYQKNKK